MPYTAQDTTGDTCLERQDAYIKVHTGCSDHWLRPTTHPSRCACDQYSR